MLYHVEIITIKKKICPKMAFIFFAFWASCSPIDFAARNSLKVKMNFLNIVKKKYALKGLYFFYL